MDEIHSSRTRLTRAAGVLAGALAGIVTVVLAGTALAHRVMQPADRPLLEATHLPPLLTTRDERIELRYDVYCARSEADAETPCAVDGTVFARAGDTGAYLEIDVREERGASGDASWQLLPESIARASVRFLVLRGVSERRDRHGHQRFRQEVRPHPSGACRWGGASGSLSAPTISATSVKRPSASWTLRGAPVRRKSVSSRAGTSCRSAARHSTSITTARWSCWTRRTSASFAGRETEERPTPCRSRSTGRWRTCRSVRTARSTSSRRRAGKERSLFSAASIGTAPKGSTTPVAERPSQVRVGTGWPGRVAELFGAVDARSDETDRRSASPSRSTQPSPVARCPTAGGS